jgi:ankyrin repeat protein
MAAHEGHAECLQLLLDAGADKDATTNVNSTPLLIAAWKGHLECVEVLLKADCDVDALDKNGNTALSAAVIGNHADCVLALVQAGADITIEADGESLVYLVDRIDNSDEVRAALLYTVEKQRICGQCELMTRGRMMKCGACKAVFYCNHDSQTAHWPLHKPVCKASERET